MVDCATIGRSKIVNVNKDGIDRENAAAGDQMRLFRDDV